MQNYWFHCQDFYHMAKSFYLQLSKLKAKPEKVAGLVGGSL